jgi:glycosyltransferase involved in cell wall biosynthesis
MGDGGRTQILFVTGANPMRGGGGLESYVRAHGLAAHALGFDPHVFCIGRRARVTREAFGHIHQVALPAHTTRGALAGLYGPLLARALNRHARDIDPVLIHAFGPYGCCAARFCRAHERRGLRSVQVTSVYNTQAQENAAIVAGVRREHGAINAIRYLARYGITLAIGTRNERRGYAASRMLLVNYESVRALLREQFGAAWEIRDMPYASDTAFSPFQDSGSEPDPITRLEPRDAPLIVSASRHDARKGVDILLRALGELKGSEISFRAALLGRGELLEPHRRLAERLALDGSVAITGQVPDVVPYLTRADVYVLPSLSESSGSVSLLEAMQAGAAIVASSCDGIPEDVVDGDSALLVRLGARAREVYEQRFSAARFTDALGELYAELGFTPERSSASARS